MVQKVLSAPYGVHNHLNQSFVEKETMLCRDAEALAFFFLIGSSRPALILLSNALKLACVLDFQGCDLRV